MGSTIRDLGNTIKEAKNFLLRSKEDDPLDEECLDSQRLSELQSQIDDPQQQHMSACVENAYEEDQLTTNRDDQQVLMTEDGAYEQQQEDEEDVIDIDNPEDLAAKGLRRIQIDGEEEEYLMDLEGNIYDLQGNFIGTTDADAMPEEQQLYNQEGVSKRRQQYVD